MIQIPQYHPEILIIDDEKGIREGLKRLLKNEHLTVDAASTLEEGRKKGLSKEWDLYLIDLKLPDGDGIELLKDYKAAFPEAVCIIMTAFGSISSAVDAVKLGAFSYITKPFLPDEFLTIVRQALEHRWYIVEARRLREEQHQRFLEVAYEQSRLKTILNSIGDGVMVFNRDQELVLYNRRLVALLELKKPLMIGENVLNLLPAVITDNIRKILDSPLEQAAIREEIPIPSRDEKIVEIQFSPILTERKELLGVTVIVRDITESKRLEKVKNQFVNMVAHELKAPIAAIVGYLDMILNRTLGEELKAYDRYIDRCIQRALGLQNLVNDLLNLSRMEAGTVRREIVDLDAVPVIREILDFYSEELKKKNIRLICRMPDSLFLRMDEEDLKKILNNLISNGIKYNRENGELRVCCATENSWVVLEIEDTGIGMTNEEQQNLFKEFYRAKNKFTRDISGTGLGLSIVKKIVDNYSGKIEVHSQFQQGTTFRVLLPKEF